MLVFLPRGGRQAGRVGGGLREVRGVFTARFHEVLGLEQAREKASGVLQSRPGFPTRNVHAFSWDWFYCGFPAPSQHG